MEIVGTGTPVGVRLHGTDHHHKGHISEGEE